MIQSSCRTPRGGDAARGQAAELRMVVVAQRRGQVEPVDRRPGPVRRRRPRSRCSPAPGAEITGLRKGFTGRVQTEPQLGFGADRRTAQVAEADAVRPVDVVRATKARRSAHVALDPVPGGGEGAVDRAGGQLDDRRAGPRNRCRITSSGLPSPTGNCSSNSSRAFSTKPFRPDASAIRPGHAQAQS